MMARREIFRGFTNMLRGVRMHSGGIARKQFAKIEESDISTFRKLLGEKSVITNDDSLEFHNNDWMKQYRGNSKVVLKPKSTEEVSSILKHCNARKLAVVPQGGNTGLVGGSVPVFDEVVLSLSSMNKVLSLDEYSGVVECEAGCILQNLEEHLAKHGFVVPLDLGSRGSCQLGGNVSTNAGGLRLIRFGSLRASVLGIEAVMADGTVLDSLKTLRKDNTGYDIKQLFIVPRKLESVHLAMLGCNNFQQVLEAVAAAKFKLAEIVSAIEFFDQQCSDLVVRNLPGMSHVLETSSPFWVLVETTGSEDSHDSDKLYNFLNYCMEKQVVEGGTVAEGGTQMRKLWGMRENIPMALLKEEEVFKYDLSVPTSEMYNLVEIVRERLKERYPQAGVFGYGHLGDGNLHLNVTCPTADKEAVESILEPFVYEWTAEKRGSISAEHGIGQMKISKLYLSKPPELIALMRQIKGVFDPNGILNPYKVLLDE
ncbi:hypothetical protein GUITHDRAFT_104792 [Guillardia theta CCMP2712]|uniref:FAD-binding PCMH-type domain-containing protein n=1 Tax=Guillardia theta (strain CCMP2712) TaxID=905079 RepID=L1JM35_GUITC|nr:hypothetical protein GUITHDRAFT_104792 [Guillardia theta CCMP2712]EKX49264.1 hypothetical protein GUITHDRAFT_104792 [Guillardia theta CCMP2712]|eukprot:XP_005836244.1 hypothetical protein GUITHDRAFT_104792 [Guillardia theta CCMP2712]